MAGKFRRKFVNIISDKFSEHYQGKVSDEHLAEVLKTIAGAVAKLEQAKKHDMKERSENLKKLKRLPLQKLKEIQKLLAANT